MAKARLDSWKSIAEYLERSSRTVQRWHASHALPVHHFGGCKGSVFAYAEEIDRWLMSLAEETRTPEFDGNGALDVRKSRSEQLTAAAREMWETRSEESLNAIAGLYRRAIDQHPGNTAALTGLANAMIAAALQGVMDSAIAYPSAMEALRRTAQLDGEDVDAKISAAWLNMVYERKWRQARAGFEFVVARRPQSEFALAGMALMHIAHDDLVAASHWAWRAWRQNALVCSLGTIVCWSQYLAGDYEAALELVSQVRMSGGCGATLAVVEALALIQFAPGIFSAKRIESFAADFPQSATLQGVLGYAYAAAGHTVRAREIQESLEQMSEQKKRNSAYGLALVCLGLGRQREAIQRLETSFAQGSLWSLGLRSDPALMPLRGHAGFQNLLRKFGPSAIDASYPLGQGEYATAV